MCACVATTVAAARRLASSFHRHHLGLCNYSGHPATDPVDWNTTMVAGRVRACTCVYLLVCVRFTRACMPTPQYNNENRLVDECRPSSLADARVSAAFHATGRFGSVVIGNCRERGTYPLKKKFLYNFILQRFVSDEPTRPIALCTRRWTV